MPRIEAIPSQRHLFEVPADVSYLDAAAWSPLPRVVRAAGEAGILTKSRPWDDPRTAFPPLAERTREAAARLIGAGADDVAIVGSVSHAMATAACNLAPARGGRLLRVADEFPSLRYAFDRLAAAHDLAVEEAPRPPDGDWTAALLAAIHKPSDKPLAIATLTPLHWTDGSLIDLDRLAPAVHAAGAALVIDATQAVGAMPVDVARWRPDFLAFPTYKWALGPYGVAFLYAAPHLQDGLPIEDNIGNRTPAAGARRYDRGELNDPVALSMAASGLDLIAAWGVPSIAARLRDLTDRLAEGVTALGLTVAPPHLRADHILGVHAPGGLPDGLMDRLQAARVLRERALGRSAPQPACLGRPGRRRALSRRTPRCAGVQDPERYGLDRPLDFVPPSRACGCPCGPPPTFPGSRRGNCPPWTRPPTPSCRDPCRAPVRPVPCRPAAYA